MDEEFASSKIKLAQVTNKCTDDDLAFYIQSIGSILNVIPQSVIGDTTTTTAAMTDAKAAAVAGAIDEKNDPKFILQTMLKQLCEFKRAVSLTQQLTRFY